MKLAIFDIDGTIFRSSLVIELVRALVRHKIFPSSAEQKVQREYLAWLDRKGSYADYINKVVKIYIKHIAGKPSEKVYKIARFVIKAQKNRVYRFTRDLIKRLKHQHYFLIAISGSPSYIVADYAKAIGFNKFFGTEMEIKKGKFTGKVLNLDSAYKKKKVLMEFAGTLTRLSASSRHPLPPQYHAVRGKKGEGKVVVDWKQSIAIGDTETDISILQIVGKPIAFNPNQQLAKVARHRKWKIIVERKDVIFQMSRSKFQISNQLV